jgi:hypothetical protein
VGPEAIREYLKWMRERHERANAAERSELLDEMAKMTGFHRKALIRAMNRRVEASAGRRRRKRGRPRRYGPRVVGALRVIWEAAGYPLLALT